MISLENEHLLINVKQEGAELTRIYSKKMQLEYLWEGDDAFWGRQAPVLFPIVGKLRNGTYRYKNKDYALSQHGFARDQRFDIISKTDDTISFCFESNEATLLVYPFRFQLIISYQLNANALTVSYQVINLDDRELLFSIGGHPGFRCPLEPGLNFDDYFLSFEHNEQPQQLMLDAATGLRTGVEKTIDFGNKVALNYELFNNDALIFEGLSSTMVKLQTERNEHGLNFRFAGWKYMAFWTKKDAPYICFEPWHGIADAKDSNQDFANKKGIIHLAGNKQKAFNYEITCF